MKCNALIDPQTKIAIVNPEAKFDVSQFPRCGYELSAEDKFCPACGIKINRSSYASNAHSDICHQESLMSQLRSDNDDENVALAIVVALNRQSIAQVQKPMSNCSTGGRRLDVGGRRKCIKITNLFPPTSVWRPKTRLEVAMWCFGLYAAGIAGAMILSVFGSSRLWLILLLLVLLGLISGAAESLLRVCLIAFQVNDEIMSPDKARVLRGLSIAVVCVPLICPAYGFLQGGIESIRYGEKGKISVARYFFNKNGMNLFTRVGYRWVYHIFWDFDGVEDNLLDTSPFGLGGFSPQRFSDTSESDGEKEDCQTQLSQSLDDSKLSMKISTALMKNDHEEARRLARQISDKDLRDFQNALIDNAESLDANQKKLQKDLKEFQDNLKAAEIRDALFGGR